MGASVNIERVLDGLTGLFLVLRPDEHFTIVAASPEYLEATQTDRSIYGRPLFDVFPGNTAGHPAENSGPAALRASLERVIQTRRLDAMAMQRYDVREPAAHGGNFEKRYWLPVNSPILTPGGEVEFIVHRVSETAASSDRNAIDILESMTEGFFTLDRQWRFDYVNKEAHKILDREPGSLVGKVVWQVYPWLENTEFGRAFHATMHERARSSFIAYYDQHDQWYDVTTSAAPEGISVYFRDVSEQKRLQAVSDGLAAASERQRRIYETALDSTPDFFYVFDTEHRALYANAALLKTWGVDDVHGKRWMDLGYEPWHADLHDREIDTVIATRAPIRGEIPFTGTDGRRVYDYIFAPVIGTDGEVVAVAGTTRDITERQAIEQAAREQAGQLAEADRSKDEFLATLSHELRNPLAPLRNAIELLKRCGSPDEASRRQHAVIERQTPHLIRLVDDLLEVSRISRGAFSLQRERVDLAAVVRHAVETSEPLVAENGQVLSVELPQQPLWLDADAVRLAQVLTNLLNNAAMYAHKAGHITLSAQAEDGFAAVRVIDDGVGIDGELLPNLFQMFRRGDRDRRRDQQGLGIGMALSRRLAEMHGGTLQGQSDGLGKGCTFTLRIPLAAMDQADAPALASPVAVAAGLRVLVVDDNRDAADTTAMLLELLGVEAKASYGGREGIADFDDWQPQVVLLDIGMPSMNGYEVARVLRSRDRDRAVTLVALTGWSQEDDRLRARSAGFDRHLTKPVDAAVLQQLLASAGAAEERLQSGG